MIKDKSIKISYRKIWDSNGTVYDQRIKIDRNTYDRLQDCIRAEINLDFPRQKEYVSSYYKLFLKLLSVTCGNLYFMNHTQRNFINLFLKVKLLDRNTYLIVK